MKAPLANIQMMNSQKKIRKVVTYYEDGTSSEWSPNDPIPKMPSIPLNPTPFPKWDNPNIFPKPTCTKCGIVLEPVMGYCCPHGDCPCGMGPIMCQTLSK
jgi:hypothetical protein